MWWGPTTLADDVERSRARTALPYCVQSIEHIRKEVGLTRFSIQFGNTCTMRVREQENARPLFPFGSECQFSQMCPSSKRNEHFCNSTSKTFYEGHTPFWYSFCFNSRLPYHQCAQRIYWHWRSRPYFPAVRMPGFCSCTVKKLSILCIPLHVLNLSRSMNGNRTLTYWSLTPCVCLARW